MRAGEGFVSPRAVLRVNAAGCVGRVNGVFVRSAHTPSGLGMSSHFVMLVRQSWVRNGGINTAANNGGWQKSKP